MRTLLSLATVVILTVGAAPAGAAPDTVAVQPARAEAAVPVGPEIGESAEATLSPRLDSLTPASSTADTGGTATPRQNPLADEPDGGARGTWDRGIVPLDPLIDASAPRSPNRTPDLGLSFDGVGNPVACNGCTPPDPNGDVGPNHYIQMVNATKIQIWDKAGMSLVGPFDMGDLWMAGPCASNEGDPIVVYDPLADRWLLSQFTGSGDTFMCFAVSTTADPTGSYWLYAFDVTTLPDFPDYFKLGVWPDGYYMSANESTYTAYVFDRENMLDGNAATFQKWTGLTNFALPSDLDGPNAPPAGDPNHFYTFKDNAFHGGSDRIEIYDLDVDWSNPGNSTFTLVDDIPIASYTYTACGFFNLECVRQLGTGQRLDQLGEWPMWRFAYRNFGSYEAMVGAFAIGGGTGDVGSAIRWFELRSTGGGWTLHQEGTHDLNDGLDRWLPSIAMDQSGNIALGYSASSPTSFPSIRYATRLASDPLGTMGTEKVLQAGGGAQTASSRWGDYASMSVDPTDDCTFWFTSEYYAATSGSTWSTRIATFVEPTCGAAQPPIASDASFSVDELASVGTAVGTVEATDSDSPSLTFSLTGGNTGGAFAIGSTTGALTVAGALDYETTPSYDLTVTVSDGVLSDTATVSVTVVDEFELPATATFTDVAVSNLFFADVEWLAWAGITLGCNPPLNDEFCPNDSVTRGQMAAFLVRALGLTDTGTTDFTDDDGSIFEADIEKLAAAGITFGCNPPLNTKFCPNDFVTRAQMAAFLVRALGYVDNGGGNLFIDDDGSIFENDIDKLGTAGVTKGCNPPLNTKFCPNDFVARTQMAAFLHRALG